MTNAQYPNVYKLLSQDDESVTMQDIINDMVSAGIDTNQLPVMEQALMDRPIYVQGLPFPGDDDNYDVLVKNNIGFALLQKFMDFWG